MEARLQSMRVARRQAGMSLVMVMVILTIVSSLGLAAMRIVTTGERGARSDRDIQVALQAAEAALMDAEFDIFGPAASDRRALFGERPDLSSFVAGCGSTGMSTGLCALSSAGKPAWLAVDLKGGRAAEFGQFTHRAFQAGGPGVTPARRPAYVIEAIPDPADRDLGSTSPKYIYRVTAAGFGPRIESQVVLQMLFRS